MSDVLGIDGMTDGDEEDITKPRNTWAAWLLVDCLVFGGVVLTAIGVGCYSIPAASIVVGVVLLGIGLLGFWMLCDAA